MKKFKFIAFIFAIMTTMRKDGVIKIGWKDNELL